MAVLPAKNAGGNQPSTGARFRQRKISVKVALPIYKQRDISSTDTSLEPSQVHHLNQSSNQQQRDLHSIETGVDKNEEDEVHLQQVINAAQKALLGSKKQDADKKKNDPSVYIPTPDASKIWTQAYKYYNDTSFKEPETYIKFSATVEDTVGCEYNMDEADEEFFTKTLSIDYPKPVKVKNEKLNKLDPTENNRKCSELEYEVICDKFEKKIEEKQPFLSVDPSNILTYEEILHHILEEFNSSTSSSPYVQLGNSYKYMTTSTVKEKLLKELKHEPFVTLFDKNPEEQSLTTTTRPIPKLLELFGRPVYEFWKNRKIERKGKQIHPSLKFEDPNASEKDNDNDPYICFRRREFRQARKTRRADTLGAERIRLLQKSLHLARNLIFSVCQREIIKLQTWESEHQIFKLRSEAKNLKRVVGVKGDDYLFYPHKRRKVAKVKEQDDDKEVLPIKARGQKRNKDVLDSMAKDKYASATTAHQQHLQHQAQLQLQQQAQQEQSSSSSTQPYVKLPPSKIPDMDLVTVSLVLKEKNETIKRAVLDKLQKRREQDKGFINVTDDPYQPFFNISTNDKDKNKELSHIPYSSIAASSYHQINTTNYMNEGLKKLLENGKVPLPGIKTFRGTNGELIPSKNFPHLLTLLQNHINNNKNNSVSYVAQLLHNIDTNNFSAYSHGYGRQYQQIREKLEQQRHQILHYNQQYPSLDEDEDQERVSDPIFRLRKRVGRANRTFVDRRGLIERPNDVIDEFLKFDDDEDDSMDVDTVTDKNKSVPNVYDCKSDLINRLDSHWQFDNDFTEYQNGLKEPFSLDPSKLNCISDDTQSIRFGSMLLSKSYDLLRESAHQRQLLIQQARMRALQQQQQHNNRNIQAASQQQRVLNQGQNQQARASSGDSSSSNSSASLLKKLSLVKNENNSASSDGSIKYNSSNGLGNESRKLFTAGQQANHNTVSQDSQAFEQPSTKLVSKKSDNSPKRPSASSPTKQMHNGHVPKSASNYLIGNNSNLSNGSANPKTQPDSILNSTGQSSSPYPPTKINSNAIAKTNESQ